MVDETDETSPPAESGPMRLIERAHALNNEGKHAESIPLYDGAIFASERALVANPGSEAASTLALALANKGSALHALHQPDRALPLFDRAIAVIEGFAPDPRGPLAPFLAQILTSKGKALAATGDLARATPELARGIAIRERLLAEEGFDRRDLATELALAWDMQVKILGRIGDARGLLQAYDRLCDIGERLAADEKGIGEGEIPLAANEAGKAAVLAAQGDHRDAIHFYDRAVDRYERCMARGVGELRNEIARALTGKAASLFHLGQHDLSLGVYDRAAAIREALIAEGGGGAIENDLATTLMGKAVVILDGGEPRIALALYDRILDLRERLVDAEGRPPARAQDLAETCAERANALAAIGDTGGAIAACDRAAGIYRRLIDAEGRRDLLPALARTHMNHGQALVLAGDARAAIALFERGARIYEGLLGGSAPCPVDVRRGFADHYFHWAGATAAAGDTPGAAALYDLSRALYTRLVEDEGRTELKNALEAVARAKRDLDKPPS